MPRLPRIQLEGAVYFVTCRALRGGNIFKNDADYKSYLSLLSKYKEQHHCKLFAYCSFRNQLYLLVETRNDLPTGQVGATISVIIHDLSTSYTKYYNSRYNRRGPLFEPRFKSMLVEKAAYLLKMTRYIHQTSETVETPYSSFPIYKAASGSSSVIASEAKQSNALGEIASSPAAPRNDSGLNLSEEIEEVLNFLKEKDRSSYERYCSVPDPAGERELKKKLEHGAVIGSDAFAEQVKDRVKQYTEEAKKQSQAGRSVSKKLLLVAGVVFLATLSLTFYSYKSQSELRAKYSAFLEQKELEFSERARFENRNPLVPTELEGTVWQVEIISAAPGNPVLKDTFYFSGGRFISYYLQSKDFNSSSYFLIPQGQGHMLWQSAQSKASGDTVSWNGEWKGDVMKGTLHLNIGGKSSTFSFYSNRWGVFAS